MSEKDEEYDETGALGGVLRSTLRRLGYLTKIEAMGRLPKRIPTKVVARSADRLGQLSDIGQHFTNAYDTVQPTISKSRQPWHVYMKMSLLAFHGFVKSAVLGGVLFCTYDGIVDCSESVDNPFSMNCDILQPSMLCGCAGMASGVAHGSLHSLWDFSAHRPLSWVRGTPYSPVPLSSVAVIGTASSHGLVHAFLFGSYELTKRASLYGIGLTHVGEDISRVEGAGCVLVAGAAAGYISEAVGSITSPLETNGLKQGFKESKDLLIELFTTVKFPSGRYFMFNICPTILGFVAYEYAKNVPGLHRDE